MQGEIQSPHLHQVLSALQYQRGSNHCGPFTTATVINALCAERLDGARLAEEMNHPAWRGPFPVIRRIPNWATFPWGMVDVFRQHGLRASWQFLGNPKLLKEELPLGFVFMPVIGSWFPLWSHVITFLSWHPGRGWGFANTQSRRQELYWLIEDRFLAQWRAMGNLLVIIPAQKQPESILEAG